MAALANAVEALSLTVGFGSWWRFSRSSSLNWTRRVAVSDASAVAKRPELGVTRGLPAEDEASGFGSLWAELELARSGVSSRSRRVAPSEIDHVV